MKEIMFDDQPIFGDPFSFYNYVKEQYKGVNPLMRTILLLKLGDLEIVYPTKSNHDRYNHKHKHKQSMI